jgi:PAS domain S-box-containing protein
LQTYNKTEGEVPRKADELRAQLDEAQDILRAIRGGEVDALVISGSHGDQVYTLKGAEHPYRVMVEAMNEGAVTLTVDGTIFYSNRSFAAMLKMPLEGVIGSTMGRFVLAEDLPGYETLIRQGQESSSKGEVRLRARDGSIVPVYLSISALEPAPTDSVCAIVTDLTEHKRNQELVASETLERTIRVEAEAGRQRIANTLESITDSFFAMDREWRITHVNQRAAAIYGQTRAELIGKVFWDFFPQDRMTEVDNQYHKAMAERVPVHFEGRSRIAEGSWFEMHVYPTEEGLAVYFRDITERKNAEEKLRRSEAYLAEGQRISHTGSWAVKFPSGDVIWSEELFRIYGLDPATTKLSQQMAFQLVHLEDRPLVQEAFERAVREKSDYAVEHRAILADGSLKHLHALGHPVLNESGTLTEYIGTVVDITERKRVEEQLRRSEAHMAEAQRLGHIGSWIWNVATGDCFWSQEHFHIFGLDPETFKPTKENTQRLIHPEDLPSVEQTLERAIRERSNFEVEYRIVRPDGSIRYHRGLGHPLVRESGELEFVGTVLDVTERRRAEEALQKAQAELAHVTRVTTMGELTASIAHEINQPLGAIVTHGQACLRLLSREPPNLDKSREVIERMISDGLRASEVIRRIRALLGKTTPEETWLSLNEVIQEVIPLVASELVRTEVRLRTELAADLPPVRGDRVQLQQVILNLIVNGKDAVSGEGWQPRELLVSSRKSTPEEVLVAVRDSGTGLDPRDSERIFDAFFTTKPGGMGLGLSISRTIVEAHGGRLWATSNEGRGATFQLALPTGGESRP